MHSTRVKIYFINFIISLLCCHCKSDDSAEPSTTVITGTTEAPVKADIALPALAKQPDLGRLISNYPQAPIQMVALGGKLLAGYRDGGWYRDAQLTAFPNLVAHQMGLSNFTSPLFEPSEGNGTGYLEVDQIRPYVSWKKVVNNRAVITEEPLTLTKYTKATPDNLSLPNGPLGNRELTSGTSLSYPAQKDFFGYLYRLLTPEQIGKKGQSDLLVEKKFNLIFEDNDSDLWYGLAIFPKDNNGNVSAILQNYYLNPLKTNSIDSTLIRRNKDNIKTILFTIPYILDLPYFHLFISPNSRELLLPVDRVKKVLLAKENTNLLNDEDVISEVEISLFKSVSVFNENFIRKPAQRQNTPVVDLEYIYKRILSGQYVTDDGLKIDPTFPGGNFFSADGLNPSAIGQAVIANETIKVINQHYGANIPIINIQSWQEILKSH